MLASFAELLRPTTLPAHASSFRERRRGIGSRSAPRAPLLISSTPSALPPKSPPILDTLRLLEWNKLCDHVASFAGTSHGREATKMKLWSLDVSYEETLRLLRETAAAVEMIKCGIGGLDLRGVDTVRVKSAIECALRGSIINGKDAMAVAIIIQSAKTLQFDLKAYAKRDASWYNRFMPLTIAISDLPVTQAFFNSVHEVIDADGSVKDTASSELKHAREQLRFLEKKLYQLMEKFIRVDTAEIAIINGRWCIKVASEHSTKFEGLLLSSGTGSESLIEPLAVVPVNDELQQARLFARKAEQDVLSKLTNEMLNEIDDIRRLFDTVIQLDVVVARAKYSTTYGGSYPDLSLPEEKMSLLNSEVGAAVNYVPVTIQPHASRRKWKLYARGAYHPLLLKNYRENLMLARKDVDDAVSELGRMRLQGQDLISSDNIESTIASLQLKAAKIEENRPVPVDITVSAETNVVVITGPNTGGKTISLKTVGLAVLMAKIGLYVIASEPVQMPWFDAVFADIGDEQSLSQSLSTFSSHLMKIGAIRSISTEQSLVLLDEVGAGTNPLEGAALGMSLLESFAKSGTLLTIATTHHGELKTLKYSNHLFDNACMEFDEINLQPTYRILWGVPGRSNAINIAERLGLSRSIVDTARLLYGTASAEINEIILEMETSKQDFEHHLQKAQETIRLARQHHERLLAAKQRINDHALKLRSRKLEEVMDAASLTRSSLQSLMRKVRELCKMQSAQSMSRVTGSTSYEKGYDKLSSPKKTQEENSLSSESYDGLSLQKANRTVAPGKALNELPKEGDKVYVSVLGKSGRVLKVYQSKAEVMVQVDRMKLRLKFTDIGHQTLQR